MTKTATYQLDSDWVKLAKEMMRAIWDSKLMANEPNANTALEKAVAIQVMAASHLVVSVDSSAKKEELEISAALLRSLVEVVANINYICSADDSDKLAKKYLKTEDQAPRLLDAIYKGKKNKYPFMGGRKYS